MKCGLLLTSNKTLMKSEPLSAYREPLIIGEVHSTTEVWRMNPLPPKGQLQKVNPKSTSIEI